MRKPYILLITILMALVLVSCGNNKSDVSKGEAEPTVPKYSVEIQLDCVRNLLFSRYDIDVFIDGEKIGKLDHGATRTYPVELEEGTHTIVVAKEGSGSVDGTIDFTVSGDSSFKYKLSCSSNQVEIKEIVIAEETESATPNTLEENSSSKETALRVVSGFDMKTNQEVLFCGVTFYIPAYYDVLEENTTEAELHFYPEREEYYSSLIFWEQDSELSQEDYNNMRSQLADSMLENASKNDKEISSINSESTTVANLPGWMISYVIDGENPSTVNCCFVLNPSNSKMVFIMQMYDEKDASNYDYVGDYRKILESAAIGTESVAQDSAYDVAYVRELTGYSLYYLIDLDEKTVCYFATHDESRLVGTFSGDLKSGIKIHYDGEEGYEETLKYKNPSDDSIAVLTQNGFDWEYKNTDVFKAEELLKQPNSGDSNVTDNKKEQSSAQKEDQDTDNGTQSDKKDELKEYQAKRAFEYYGENLYPYGFECHWYTKLYEHTQLDDGSWKFKVGVTVTNRYGASVEAIAEALINNTTQSVEDFEVYTE